MTDKENTKEQLTTELVKLSRGIAEIQNSETRRNQTEEALREVEARYRELF